MTWDDHKQNYKMLAASTGMSIAEYAAQHGLNPNTARRYLRSGDAQPAGKKVVISAGGDQSGDQDTDKGKKATRKPTEKQKKKAAAREKVSKYAGQPARGRKAVAQPTLQMMGEVISRVRDQVPQYDSDGALEDAGLIDAARFLVPTPDDMSEARALLEKAGADNIEMITLEKSLAHLLLLERGREQIIKLYSEVREVEKGETPPVMKLMGVFLSTSEAIANLSRTMAQLRQSYHKERRDQEKHDQKLGEPAIIKRAYRMRKSEGWSALETAEYIEMHGGKVPPLLLELVRTELKAPPEKSTDTGETSPAELDRRARERQAAQAAEQERMIAEKRQNVAHMLDELGVGDLDENGALNDAALAAPFADDEEPDEALNAELYGDNDQWDDLPEHEDDGA